MKGGPKVCTHFFVGDCAMQMAEYYVSVIPDSEITAIRSIGSEPPFLVEFTIAGAHFVAMNGNENFEARPDHSIGILTVDQAETDRLWDTLIRGGREGPCGWLQDQFGIHWQIVPEALVRLMSSGDPDQSRRVQAALRRMTRIDISALEAAAAGSVSA